MRVLALLAVALLMPGCATTGSAPATAVTRALPPGWQPAAVADAPLAIQWLGEGAQPNVEPSLAVSPTDAQNILVGWTIRGEGTPGSTAQIRVAETTDGGASWRLTSPHDPDLPDVPGSVPYQFDVRTGFFPDGTAVVLYGGDMQRVGNAADPEDRITFMTSKDGGATWSYRLVAAQSGALWDYFGLAIAPDTGHVFVATDSIPEHAVNLWRSVDGGATWEGPSVQAPAEVHPGLEALPGGVLVMATIEGLGPTAILDPTSLQGRPGFVVRASHDDGRTFSPPKRYLDGADAALNTPNLAEGSADGHAMIHGVGARADGTILDVSSADAGATWSKPAALSATAAGRTTAWSVIAAGAHGEAYTLTRSGDSAMPWRMDLDVAPPTGAPHRVPLASGARPPHYPGEKGRNASDDYGGLAVAPDGTVFAAFADARDEGASRIALVRIAPG